MKLRQKLEKPVSGYWDGGKKQIFDWEINGPKQSDKKGCFVKIGSLDANHWFHVSCGKTEKQTLSYAEKHLKASTRIPSTFEYVEEKQDKKKK